MTTNRKPAVTPVAVGDLVMIDPRTPWAPEHLADFAAEVEVIEAETDADLATPEQIAETVLAHYLTIAVENRWDDLDDYLADVDDDPWTIVAEVLDTAADLGYLAGAATEDDATYAAIADAARTFTYAARRRVYAEQARQAGERAVAEVRAEVAEYAAALPVGTRVRHTNGDTGEVVAGVVAEGVDVWVTIAFDDDETERRHPSTVTPL